MLTVLNLLISIADILILAALFIVVSLYTNINSSLINFLPEFLNNKSSILPVTILLLAFVIKNLVAYLVFQKQSRYFFNVAIRLSRQKLLDFLHGNFGQYVASDRAKIFNLVNYRPIEFAQNILTNLQLIFTEFTIVFFTVITILVFKPIVFLLLIVFLLPPILISSSLIKKKIKLAKEKISNDSEKANQYLNESLSGYIESNIYQKHSFFSNRHYLFQNRMAKHLSQLQIAQWIPGRIVEVFAVFGLFILLFITLYSNVKIDILSLGAFFAGAYKIMPGIARISNAAALIRTYEHVIDDLNTGGIDVAADKEGCIAEEIFSIRADNISFQYNDRIIINGVNVVIEKGDFVCIQGASGIGKTTFINLLLGFIRPQKGRIIYNNRLNSERPKCFSSITYVKQQTLLIHDSIEKNITLNDSETDEHKLRYAIEFAELEPLIDGLQNGIKSIIADDGKNISGGQKQRIALARALYHEANFMIFDEPFNELDQNSEIRLLKKLKTLSDSGKIILLVSHSNLCLDYCNKTIDIN